MKRLPHKYHVLGVFALIYGVISIVFWPGFLISLGLFVSGIALVRQNESWLRRAPRIMHLTSIGLAFYSVLAIYGIMRVMEKGGFGLAVMMSLVGLSAFLVANSIFAIVLSYSAFSLRRHLTE